MFQGFEGKRCCKYLTLFYSYRMKQASPPAECLQFQEADLNQSLEWAKDVHDEGFLLKIWMMSANLCA